MTPDKLKALVKQLPPIEGADTWANHRRSIRQHILTEDVKSFLRWSTIRATMYVDAPFIPKEYNSLSGRLKAGAWGKGFGGMAYRGYDTNLIHQAYHLSQWERVTEQQVNKLNQVIEFGGGYGAMCLLCQRLGYQGSYWIEDLPELLALQEYYLSHTKLPHQGLPYHYKCDLFIASHSLSEIPIEQRHKILKELDTDSFLFVFHCQHNEVDNLEWFRQLIEDNPQYNWQQWYTPHLPNQWYQVGIKR